MNKFRSAREYLKEFAKQTIDRHGLSSVQYFEITQSLPLAVEILRRAERILNLTEKCALEGVDKIDDRFATNGERLHEFLVRDIRIEKLSTLCQPAMRGAADE